jgi:predicted ATPase
MAARKHNLSVQPTPFVGREAALAEIADRLQDPDCRLLTLVGPGGSGKTRLALEAVAAQLDDYTHGVFFVSLAPLQSVDAIVPTVAQAIGFSFYAVTEGSGEVEPQQQLLDYLRQKNMLLIMDNFEHLLACPERCPELVEGPSRRDGAGLVVEILKTAPNVKIVATSRARLKVQGEHLLPVAGMSFPDEETIEDASQYSAVRLFLASARRAQPGFELTTDNLTHVVRICRLVDGMPLGILLAAAWVQMLTPAEIAAEIGQSLDFLETDLHDVPERQRSMRAVFDHSWRLLTEREREVFQGLSVFLGGFTRQAAGQVTGASLRELMALVNKSLLHRMPTGRYEVHELLRQHAAEKLDGAPAASEAARDRHSAYYAAALQGWAADLKGPRQQAAMAEIEADSENARAAWNWAVERGQVERVEQALDGLCRFYEWRGRYPEIIAAAQAAIHLAQTAQDVHSEAAGYLWWGRTLWRQGDHEAARSQLKQALALTRAAHLRQVEADSLRNLGNVCYYQGDYAGAGAYYVQALLIYREISDRQGEGATLNNLAIVSDCHGDYAGARAYYEQALLIKREVGDRQGEGTTLAGLSLLSHRLGDNEAAREYSQQALHITQELGDRHFQGYALTFLGHALVGLGHLAEAAAAYQQALALRRELGQPNLAMEPLAGLARVSLTQGNLHQAQAHVEEILSYLESNTLDGTEEPFRVYLTCYRVLRANQDLRAQAILDTAYSLLQEQAAKISDEEMRHSFLENVAAHREVMSEFANGNRPEKRE